ncbi:hypothetical protein GCM10010412_073960 [Nonomuraea recticatena]|uniref:Secreted protein n=1 Tax=Nonomuraea recticatena TaxID=46178 RepID=A0ABP6FCI1_9ACTN
MPAHGRCRLLVVADVVVIVVISRRPQGRYRADDIRASAQAAPIGGRADLHVEVIDVLFYRPIWEPH